MLNEDEQWRLLSRRFDDVFGPDLNVLKREGWRWCEPRLVIRHGRKFFERLCDELIAPEELIDSGDPFHAALGRCYDRYRDLLLEEGSADFDHLQRWAAELLEDGRTAGPISAGIGYLICDEYQDTSYAQEHILLRLCRHHGNICVVGDADQGIYRFRGASVRNLLEFPGHFSRCHTVELNVNHRSHPSIVDFYDRWMATAADWSNPDPQGRPFRHPKSITSHGADRYPDYPAVIRVVGCDAGEEGTQLAELLRFLKRKRVIAEYGQVALLLHSVRGTEAAGYLDALERAGIPVNRRPSGSEGRRAADRPRALTVTTVHQAKGREWNVVIVGSLDYCNPDGDPVGRELQPYCLRPSFEPVGRTSDFDHARQHYVAFFPAKGPVGTDLGWSGASPLGGCLGPSAPLGQHGPRGAGPAAVQACRATRQNGTVFEAGACHSIPEASRRVGGPRRIAGKPFAAGAAGVAPFLTISADDHLCGDVPAAATPAQGGEQHLAHRSGRRCENPGSSCPEARCVPVSTCCHTGGPVASANLRGQTPALKQTRIAESPAVTG